MLQSDIELKGEAGLLAADAGQLNYFRDSSPLEYTDKTQQTIGKGHASSLVGGAGSLL